MSEFETKKITCIVSDGDDDCGVGAGARFTVTMVADCHEDGTVELEEIVYLEVASENGDTIYSSDLANAAIFPVTQWRTIDNYVRATFEDQRIMFSELFKQALPIEITYTERD